MVGCFLPAALVAVKVLGARGCPAHAQLSYQSPHISVEASFTGTEAVPTCMHSFTCVPKRVCAARAQVEQVADPALPVAEIVRRCPARQLMALYRVPAYADADEFLRHVAAARGKLRKGGVTDTAVRLRGSGYMPDSGYRILGHHVAAARGKLRKGGAADTAVRLRNK